MSTAVPMDQFHNVFRAGVFQYSTYTPDGQIESFEQESVVLRDPDSGRQAMFFFDRHKERYQSLHDFFRVIDNNLLEEDCFLLGDNSSSLVVEIFGTGRGVRVIIDDVSVVLDLSNMEKPFPLSGMFA